MAWKSGVYRSYSHLSSFFWDSSLSEERKNEILEWVKSLSDEDAASLRISFVTFVRMRNITLQVDMTKWDSSLST